MELSLGTYRHYKGNAYEILGELIYVPYFNAGLVLHGYSYFGLATHTERMQGGHLEPITVLSDGENFRAIASDREPEILYRAMNTTRKLWIRPEAMFTELVEVEGATVPRFELMHLLTVDG